MSLVASEGLMLRIAPHGESDKLATWYDARLGRVTAIAKGAQKSKKRFMNKLEPFSQLRLFWRPPRSPSGLYFLEDAELVRPGLALRREYPRFLAASCIAELCLRFTRELDADPRVFQLLVWAVDAVTGQSRFFRYPLFFHLKLLELAGYTPNLSVCHRCGRPLTGPACFDPGRQEPGGAILVCQRCLPGSPKAALSLQSIRMAGYAQHSSLDSLHKLQAPSRCLVEALDLLHAYSQCLLQGDLHAWPLLRRLLAGEGAGSETRASIMLDRHGKVL